MKPQLLNLIRMTDGLMKLAVSARYVANAYTRGANALVAGRPGAPTLGRLDRFADKAKDWTRGAHRRAIQASLASRDSGLDKAMRPISTMPGYKGEILPALAGRGWPTTGREVDPALHSSVWDALHRGYGKRPVGAYESPHGASMQYDGRPLVLTPPSLATYLHEMGHASRAIADGGVVKNLQTRPNYSTATSRVAQLREYLANRAIREAHEPLAKAIQGYGLDAPTRLQLQAQRRPAYESYSTYAMQDGLRATSRLSLPGLAEATPESTAQVIQGYPPFMRRMLQARERARQTASQAVVDSAPGQAAAHLSGRVQPGSAGPLVVDQEAAARAHAAWLASKPGLQAGTAKSAGDAMPPLTSPIVSIDDQPVTAQTEDDDDAGESPSYQDSSSVSAQGAMKSLDQPSAGYGPLAMSAPLVKPAALLRRILRR